MTENANEATENAVAVPARPDWMPEKAYTMWDLIHRLHKIVEDKPCGYRYDKAHAAELTTMEPGPGCFYWHDIPAEPGCIIGQLLTRLGVPSEILAEMDRDAMDGTGISNQADKKLPGMFTREAVACLQYLQTAQDNGKPWSQAVEAMEAFRAGYRSGTSALPGEMDNFAKGLYG